MYMRSFYLVPVRERFYKQIRYIIILLNCRKEQIMQYRKQISQLSSKIGLKNDIEVSFLLRDTFERGENIFPFYRNIRGRELRYMGKELW